MHTLHVTESAQEESSLCIYNAFTVYAQTTQSQTHDRILPLDLFILLDSTAYLTSYRGYNSSIQ